MPASKFPRARANAIVLTSMLGTAAIIVVGEASRGELPRPRRILALGLVYVGLAGLAVAAPAVAAPFALTVMIATALARGEDAAAGALAAVRGEGDVGTLRGAESRPTAFPVGSTDGSGDIAPVEHEPGGSGPLSLVPLPPPLATRAGISIRAEHYPSVVMIAARFPGLQVSSAYRAPADNRRVRGATRSDHLCGNAADFVGPMSQMIALRKWAEGRYAYVDGPDVNKDGGHDDHTHVSFERC